MAGRVVAIPAGADLLSSDLDARVCSLPLFQWFRIQSKYPKKLKGQKKTKTEDSKL